MGITVNPTFVPAPPPLVVSSPDGILTANVDVANAGVLLWADYSTSVPTPQKVRFYRGDGSLVRSGDPAWAPGGVAVAYDHEAPIMSTAAYYAVPQDVAGVQGASSATAAVQVPAPVDVNTLWVKSPSRPDLSALAWVEDPPQITRVARNTFQPIRGSRLGVASWDVRAGQDMTLTIVTETIDDADELDALLDSGPLLVQNRPEYGLPDFYALPGDVQRTRIGGMNNPASRWTVPLTECSRPATLEAPLRIPGNTWDSVVSVYPTWADETAQNTSWLTLLGGF